MSHSLTPTHTPDSASEGLEIKKTSSDFFNAAARFETIIHVNSAFSDPDAFPDSIQRFYDSGLGYVLQGPIIDDNPNFKKLLNVYQDGHDDDELYDFWDQELYDVWDGMVDVLAGMGGFIIRFEAAVHHFDGETSHYGWNNYAAQWRWFETIEQAEIELIKWAEDFKEKRRQAAVQGQEIKGDNNAK